MGDILITVNNGKLFVSGYGMMLALFLYCNASACKMNRNYLFLLVGLYLSTQNELRWYQTTSKQQNSVQTGRRDKDHTKSILKQNYKYITINVCLTTHIEYFGICCAFSFAYLLTSYISNLKTINRCRGAVPVSTAAHQGIIKNSV